MSFKKTTWIYTPPRTVPAAPLPANTNPSPTNSSSSVNVLGVDTEAAANASNAAQLINRIKGLSDTGTYLESLILARSQGIGVSFDYTVDPELSAALTRLYSSDSPPPGMTVDMYNNLLDAEFGVMKADMALQGTGSNLLVSPQQRADILRSTQAFEDALAGTGEFRHQVPLLLRELKGDNLTFASLQTGLQKYPVLAGSTYQPTPPRAAGVVTGTNDPTSASSVLAQAQASLGNSAGSAAGISYRSSIQSIDVNSQTTAELNSRLQKHESVFGAMYNLATGIDQTYSYIHDIANKYLYQPLDDLCMILSAIMGLKTLFHKPKLSDLKGMLASLILPRLISEVSDFNFLLDRILQRVTSPVMAVINSLDRLFGEVVKDANAIAYLTAQGGLTGIIKSHISGTNQTPAPKTIQALGQLPAWTASIGGKLSWAVHETQRKATTVEGSFLKSMDRRLQASGGRLDLMADLRSVDALVDIFKGLILQTQKGSLQSVSQASGTSNVEALGQMVNSLQSENGTVFSYSGDQIVATPPNLPVPSAPVSTVLARGGANILDPTATTRIQVA